jgi:hypothetical protein
MIRPDFLDQHPDPIVRALGTVAWHRETLEDDWIALAGDVAEAVGLNRTIVLCRLMDVANILDLWAQCYSAPGCYALGQGIATARLMSWQEWGEAECAVLAADARSDLERLVRDARPHLTAVSS